MSTWQGWLLWEDGEEGRASHVPEVDERGAQGRGLHSVEDDWESLWTDLGGEG
jgi:hypothetical protein